MWIKEYMATVFESAKKTPYYTSGVENVAWTDITVDSGASFAKETNYMHLQAAYSEGITDAAVRTSAKVDLTGIDTLYFDCENSGTDTTNNFLYLIAGSGDNDNPGSGYSARLEIRRNFERQIKSLDVSALSGEYYLRIIARANLSDSACDVKVYNVWGV